MSIKIISKWNKFELISYARRFRVGINAFKADKSGGLCGMSSKSSSEAKWKVFVTRRIPPTGVELLKSGNCVVSQWDSDDPVPSAELMKGVQGCHALFCLLTDRIDKNVLDSAGT